MNSQYSVPLCFSFVHLVRMAMIVGLAFVGNAGAVTTFTSPEQAVSALSTALNSKDTNALVSFFGPAIKDLKSPDAVQAQNEIQQFTSELNASNHIARMGENACVLEIGQDRSPFAIPLVRTNGGWFFDIEAGKEELLNRRIGNDELQALSALRTVAQAQREYASSDREGDGILKYAQKFMSSPDRKDGLYWPPDLDGEISPLGPAFVAAQKQGYFKKNRSPDDAPQPFHGYYYKILTCQGSHAAGGKYDYIINGNMIGGFAAVAWPAEYGVSGVMTFIINQQGKIFQKDLGPKTDSIVQKMKAYDPDPTWTRTRD